MVESHGLYLASWEYLYLRHRKPAGLPNQLFFHHPWLLIPFENIYCDQNAYDAEWKAWKLLGWTNSGLFVELAERRIIQPIPVQERLAPALAEISKQFKDEQGCSVDDAMGNRTIPLERLFGTWRMRLLDHFMREFRLSMYDWPLAPSATELPSQILGVDDVLRAECPDLPLTKDLGSELSANGSRTFRRLQELEAEPLADLRYGNATQEEYLAKFDQYRPSYNQVDTELTEGLDQRLDVLLRCRDRFAKLKGWDTVREILQAPYVRAEPKDLQAMKKQFHALFVESLRPTIGEYGTAAFSVSVTSALFLGHLAVATANAVSGNPTEAALAATAVIGEASALASKAAATGDLVQDTMRFIRAKRRARGESI